MGTHKLIIIWSTHINQNEQQRFNFNVLTHDAMWGMVLAERVSLSVEAPTHHVIEAIHRISHVTELVNALFWSTQGSTQT